MADPVTAFRRTMADAGFNPPERITPGKMLRFSINGKRGDTAGWCVLFEDQEGGVFGNWRTGAQHHWQADREYSVGERQEFARRIARAQAQADAERKRLRARAAERARRAWNAARAANPAHPYLHSKQIRPHGIRQKGDRLLVPLFDADGVLHGLQLISPDGVKRFGAGTAKKGHYCPIGNLTGTLAIAEGYATGATIHEATGHAVAVAFDRGNLRPVAERLRAKYPGLRILIAGDNDRHTTGNPGKAAAIEAAGAVEGIALIPQFGADEEGTDWNDIAAYRGRDAVRSAFEDAMTIRSTPRRETSFASFASFAEEETPTVSPAWPGDLARDALHGLAGDVIRTIEPHSEADPVALLVTFLSSFGNIIGPAPHFRVEGDRHAMRINPVLVGETSKGRKGTTWGQIRRLLEKVDDDWIRNRNVEGLSSGEGLIWAVRDPIREQKPIKADGRVVDYEDVIVDKGVEDKRLQAIEGEFARVLKVLGREGNTLSALVRTAWDTGDLKSLTKSSPAKATGAHITIMGHITKRELVKELSATEAANGFGNRFVWVMARRSKCLPFGGDLTDEDLIPLAYKVRQAVDFARKAGEITWAQETRPLWVKMYPALSEGRPGMVGAMLSRAEAQVTRLACVYALLDRSTSILPEHLRAALAIWEYVEASVRFIFGTLTGNPVADEILGELRKVEGLTRTEISELFQRHKSKEEIAAALATLERLNLARCEKEQSGGGRPREVWRNADSETSETSEESRRYVA